MPLFDFGSPEVKLQSRDGVRRITVKQGPNQDYADFMDSVRLGRHHIRDYERQKKAAKKIRGKGNK